MTLGVSPLSDLDADRRAKELGEMADATTRERERADAARVPLPRPRMPCPRCAGRRWELVGHIARCCATCGGTACIEQPL